MAENTIPDPVDATPINEDEIGPIYTPPSVVDLTLTEVLVRLVSHPAQTLRGLSDALNHAVEERPQSVFPTVERTVRATPVPRAAVVATAIDGAAMSAFGAMAASWLLAVAGGIYMLHNVGQKNTNDLAVGGTLMLIGAVVFALSAARTISFPRLPALDVPKGKRLAGVDDFLSRYGLRVALVGVSLLMSAGAWAFNGKNTFTAVGVLCWLLSVIGWSIAFAPEILPAERLEAAARWLITLPNRVLSFRISWTLIALIVILIVGAYFRFSNLEAYPPDMTSDHVEKALDSQMISEGYRPVFLPNNGGREVAHFYLLAILHDVLNVPMNFNLLKLATGLEGMLGILVAYWLGRAFIGEENPQLGNLTGLALAALIAISYWHIMLSRLGLRIILTPFVISVVLIYFVRALRHNRREDYIKAGLALGIGVYCYQAVRMAPVFIVIGFILAVLLRVRNWRTLSSYLFNFIALVLIAVAVFVPLGRYALENRDSFWARTTGRIFGEDTIEVKDPQTGSITSRIANTQDRVDALRQNIGFFGSNMQTALLMFNWRGDSAWVTGSPGAWPQLDTVTGALFVIGLGIWVVRMIRRRDPGDWLIPFGIVVMLFPTALALAFTIEVPSGTRASGTMPFVYLLAAFAAAVILRQGWRALNGALPRAGLVAATVVIVMLAASANYNTYFVQAMTEYRASTLPHHQAGTILNGFAKSTGAPGNAFMIAYDYWWDHRALAIEAGDIHWNNGILRDNYIQRIIQTIKENFGTSYAFRPDRQMLFFLNQKDNEVLAGLQAWLPNSTVEKIKAFNSTKDFLILVVPPVGCQWFEQNIGPVQLSPVCALKK